MEQVEKAHFNSIAEKYHETAKTWEILYTQSRNTLNPLVKNKVVADVGSGGVFVFDPGLTEKTTCLDISKSMLDQIKDNRVSKVVADARTLDGVKDASLDMIVFNFSLHHINGKNVGESLDTLDAILSACEKKLVPGGKLAIGEPVLATPAFWLESFLFPITKWILGCFGVSMIYQFNKSLLVKSIVKGLGCQKSDIDIQEIKIENSFDPLGGSFPGLIKIPEWLYPARFLIFVATKPTS